MKSLRLIAGIGLMTAAFIASSTVSFATPDLSKKEKKPCATCHESKMPKKDDPTTHKLNATGKFYKEKKTLEGAPK